MTYVTCPNCSHDFIPERPALPSPPPAANPDADAIRCADHFADDIRHDIDVAWSGTSDQVFDLFTAWRVGAGYAPHYPDVSQRRVGAALIRRGWTWKRSSAGRKYSPPTR